MNIDIKIDVIDLSWQGQGSGMIFMDERIMVDGKTPFSKGRKSVCLVVADCQA